MPPDRRPATLRTLTTWIRQAKLASAVAVLIGPRGRHWVDESLAALTADQITTEADHQLCHFGIKVSPGDALPSSLTVHTRTTVKVNPHPCKCAQDQQHQFEKAERSKVPAKQLIKDGALQQVYALLIQELGSQLGLSSEVVPRLRSQPDTSATAPDNRQAQIPQSDMPDNTSTKLRMRAATRISNKCKRARKDQEEGRSQISQ